MSDQALRARLIRLAHDNPAIRNDILPLLAEHTAGDDKVAASGQIRYMKRLPVQFTVTAKHQPHSSGMGSILLNGKISAGPNDAPVVFSASVAPSEHDGWLVSDFQLVNVNVTGASSDAILDLYKEMVQIAVTAKGDREFEEYAEMPGFFE